MGHGNLTLSSPLSVPALTPLVPTISSILVHAGSSTRSETFVEAAVGVANRLEARLLGVITAPNLALGSGLHAAASEQYAAELIVQAAGERFEVLAARVRAGAMWRSADGPPAAALTRLASAADLIMTNIRWPSDEGSHDDSLKTLVVDGGRPVLVRPPAAQMSAFEQIAILWDRSPACGRAIAAALPFIARARRTTLMVESHQAGPESAERIDDLRQGLALRGLKIEVTTVEHGVGRDRSHRAAMHSLSADLLVMAGWRRPTPWLSLTDDTDAVVGELTTYALISH